MKYIRTYLVMIVALIAWPLSIWAQAGSAALPALIPLPVTITPTADAFYITPATRIVAGQASLNKIAGLLNGYVIGYGGKSLSKTAVAAGSDFISLTIDSTAVPYKEGYLLHIDKKAIRCIGHDAGGVLHGLQTLRQLWSGGGNSIKVPGYTIDDHPRFAYRGMALDVSRHLFPVSFIKKYIDLLALYKFNTFHWHLTDDQGWRIEIKQYPKLQSVAAWRNETLIGHKKELPHRFDGKRYGGYYTQQQIKEVVQYAADRQITIIPEIEMPGHASAALAAYPALGCTGGPYTTATYWGVFDDVYCAGNDSTFVFLQNVLDEVMALFPSAYIHIGGDECPKTRWRVCAKCQQRKRALRLADEHALQSYFIQRMEQYVNSKGRHIIGWDEILEGGLAPNATVMSWRGEEGGKAAIAQHHRVIMTPETNCYFDYYQSLYNEEPLAAGGFTPLQKVYGYEPLAGNTDNATSDYLAGVEGQAWSEYYTSEKQAAYMIFPRAMALAELAWTPTKQRNYDNFLNRLRGEARLLKQEKINYDAHFDDITYTSAPLQNNVLQINLQSSYPGGEIRFTTDNTGPTSQSALYTSAVEIKNTCTVKALLFNKKHQPAGRLFQQAFRIHKAVGAAVTLQNKPMDRFNPGNTTLVNGLFGSNRYNDNQWLGFSGNDLQAVIDLGKEQTVQHLSLEVLNYHWQRMWAPVTLQLLASKDGAHYSELYRQDSFPVNGINRLDVPVTPVQAQYIKVIGTNKGTIPAGEYGAGGNALLLIDEIVVE
ncbi:beta-hexosaminidase [Niastella koreensis]|uniref:beta-N-acetylhexosaminidase n=2 Tax=Niastella koreensis TaxID=354356 RepID=G8TBH9_NIAKG|nr:family 20 glycosylhydrolase [Niastella koreensis]AEW03479.1 Beta-N-acetylhexosaminidase [Niastella koreensis GR20-10]OQP53842.1 beta-hexosaminidase [Niastella koreensis]